eukprot:354182-Chlamydomonas_euryale.AAC.4
MPETQRSLAGWHTHLARGQISGCLAAVAADTACRRPRRMPIRDVVSVCREHRSALHMRCEPAARAPMPTHMPMRMLMEARMASTAGVRCPTRLPQPHPALYAGGCRGTSSHVACEPSPMHGSVPDACAPRLARPCARPGPAYAAWAASVRRRCLDHRRRRRLCSGARRCAARTAHAAGAARRPHRRRRRGLRGRLASAAHTLARSRAGRVEVLVRLRLSSAGTGTPRHAASRRAYGGRARLEAATAAPASAERREARRRAGGATVAGRAPGNADWRQGLLRSTSSSSGSRPGRARAPPRRRRRRRSRRDLTPRCTHAAIGRAARAAGAAEAEDAGGAVTNTGSMLARNTRSKYLAWGALTAATHAHTPARSPGFRSRSGVFLNFPRCPPHTSPAP